MEQINALEQSLAQANLSVKNSNHTGTGDNYFRRNYNPGSNQYTGGRGGGRGRGCGGQNTNSNHAAVQCQVCNKYGHTAVTCYHQFDHAYQAPSKQKMAALIAHPSTINDPAWYPDSGATNHLINDITSMTVRGEYNGNEQVQVGNGAGLAITHIGNSKFSSYSRPLQLKNVLRVPIGRES